MVGSAGNTIRAVGEPVMVLNIVICVFILGL
jgi:hypothetical protein